MTALMSKAHRILLLAELLCPTIIGADLLGVSLVSLAATAVGCVVKCCKSCEVVADNGEFSDCLSRNSIYLQSLFEWINSWISANIFYWTVC